MLFIFCVELVFTKLIIYFSEMEIWEIALIIIGVVLFLMLCVFIYANLPTRITLGNRTPTVEYLKEGKLRLTETGKHGRQILREILKTHLLICKCLKLTRTFSSNKSCISGRRNFSRWTCTFGSYTATGLCFVQKRGWRVEQTQARIGCLWSPTDRCCS